MTAGKWWRDPLTARHPRTLRETQQTPLDYWASGKVEALQEHAEKLQFEQQDPPPLRLRDLAVVVAVAAVLLAMMFWQQRS
jgi:hypothetical protein